VKFDQVLARLELDRVHAVEQELLARRHAEVLLVEFGRHRAPDLGALDIGDVALGGEVHPIGLIELWPDEVVEVGDPVVLADEGSCRSGEQIGVSHKFAGDERPAD
jgi:hypothetical protein